jgi:hypothetical protein
MAERGAWSNGCNSGRNREWEGGLAARPPVSVMSLSCSQADAVSSCCRLPYSADAVTFPLSFLFALSSGPHDGRTCTHHETSTHRDKRLAPAQGIWQQVPEVGEGFPEDFIPFLDMNAPTIVRYPKKKKGPET